MNADKRGLKKIPIGVHLRSSAADWDFSAAELFP
jgi:hypothetical protein